MQTILQLWQVNACGMKQALFETDLGENNGAESR